MLASKQAKGNKFPKIRNYAVGHGVPDTMNSSWDEFREKVDKFMEEKSNEAKSPQYHIIMPGSGGPQPANCWLWEYSQEASLPAFLYSYASTDMDFNNCQKQNEGLL